MRKITALLTSALLVSGIIAPALAQDWHNRDHGHDDFHHDDWHWHGDIHAFNQYDFDHWRGGHWWQGYHDGRYGWWWMVGGAWYFYPSPVYPYPDPFTPPTVIVETAPSAAGSAYYYCSNPAGYYPYVGQCYGTWQRVVSAGASPQVVITPPPQPPAPVVDQHGADYQKLNAFAAEFQQITPADPQARKRLKSLATRVSAFRKALYKRNYNAMDVLEDSENLLSRISAERTAIAKHHVVVQSPVPETSVVAPAPTYTATPPTQPMAPTPMPSGALPPTGIPPH